MASKNKILTELSQHYSQWTRDNQKRMTRKNGWNDITDAYYGKLPNDWPYTSKIVDPRIRTTLIEKNARILNSKLRGRLIPREGGDNLSAQINNSVLDFQWESANDGGSMHTKMSICDMDARLYQSKFGLVKWRYEIDNDGKCVFDGNEFTPLDIRDCGMDSTASHIRDAKWFQHRSWEKIEDLENQTDSLGESAFENVNKLKKAVMEKLPQSRSASRTTEYTPRVTQLRGLEDHTGEDLAFPVVKLVTEYRRDRWITFAPDFNIILRDIPNPYDHGLIPIAQLRYYPLQDDPLGESEVEPVLPLWLGIQATLCSYMDEVILKMRPPLKIIANSARIETIQYGPEAQWLVDRQDAVEEMAGGAGTIQYFQTTYQALVAAFNTAMGDFSQGVSNFGPFQDGDKTATEVKAVAKQQNTRDQKNQNDLGEFIKDIMMMWLSNNKQFLFSDPDRIEYVVKIVGQEAFNYFKRAGLDEMNLDPETTQMIADIIEQNPDITPDMIAEMSEAGSIPKYPVVENPKEKDPSKLKVKPKMKISELGDDAEVSIVPEDLQGTFDYVADVRSMAIGAGEEMAQARQAAISLFTSNPTVLQLLAQEGFRPNVKELISSTLEGLGLKDADRFFEELNEQNPAQTGTAEMGGIAPNTGEQGLPAIPQANPTGGVPQPMARPITG